MVISRVREWIKQNSQFGAKGIKPRNVQEKEMPRFILNNYIWDKGELSDDWNIMQTFWVKKKSHAWDNAYKK